jgi:FMN phosphatase YigB (HAD superfamily)
LRTAAAGVIEAVFFDLDGTLYSSPALDAAYTESFCRYVAGVQGRRQAVLAAAGRRANAAGSAATTGPARAAAGLAAVLKCFEDNFGVRPPWSMLLSAFGEDIHGWHRAAEREVDPADYLARDPQLAAALGAIKAGAPLHVEDGARGAPGGEAAPRPRVLAVVTNNSEAQAARSLRALGAFDLLDFIVSPRGPADLKPFPDMYRRALQRAARGPGQCLAVGDRRDVDLAPAAALGMAVWQASGAAGIAGLVAGTSMAGVAG